VRPAHVCLVIGMVLLSGGPTSAWQVYRLEPFVEATADQLPGRLGPVARQFTLIGLQNDWIHEGLAIATTGEERATVRLHLSGSQELREHVRLRVVGFIKDKGLGYVLDPILETPKALELDRFKQYMRNFANIYEFPSVIATPRDPVAIWLTADTRDMKAGRYQGMLTIEGEDGEVVQIPLLLIVKPYELPQENPLITCGWQWIPGAPTKAEGARLLLDYGINACHCVGDMEAARAAGFKFFLFVFDPSWHNPPAEQADEEAVDKRITLTKAMIEKLKLQPHEWALYTIDEPRDATVPNQVKWCEYIKSKWPEARFLFNPGWGPGPTNEWCSIEGTIEPLLAYANIWLPYSWWLWDDKAPRSLELMRQHGEQVWFYEIMNHAYTRRPSVGREMMRTLAWTAWKYQLQGASWYALNACDWPWSSDPQKTGHGCMYGAIPGRGLEALREGIQEYKRLHELHRWGVDEATLNSFVQRALQARRVSEIDRVRREMDNLLISTSRSK